MVLLGSSARTKNRGATEDAAGGATEAATQGCRAFDSITHGAVRTPPMCKGPVGEGAKRTRTPAALMFYILDHKNNDIIMLF